MKNRPYVLPAFLALVALLFADCASGAKKTKTAPSTPPASARTVKAEQAGERAQAPKPEASLPAVHTNDIQGDSESRKNGGEEREDASQLLEGSLAAYQEAQSSLEREEFDNALAKLDEAYALLLDVEAAPDSALCQEKNDLRILIAQKIQQIYATHLKPAVNNNGTIPLVENKWVLDEIKSFQTRERKYFEESYKRSGLFRPMIVKELTEAGLPEALSWLPLIESGFKIRALSRAKALGLWQFIRTTGFRFGLKLDKYVDERMDPPKATRAAVQYLSELHDFFGDWTTALASYNCGEMRVQNVIRAQKIDYLDNFWDLFNNLPYETARFVPRFIATLLIIENPAKYGFELPTPDPPLVWETVTVSQPVKLADLSSALGLDPAVLLMMNAELRNNSTPNYEYALKVPETFGEKTMAALPTLPRYIPPDAIYGWHRVRSGDTLGSIAKRYRTTVAAITRMNGIRNPRLLRIGQQLKIPGKGQDSSDAKTGTPPPAPGARVDYTVRPGDTLYTLAKQFKTTIAKIKSANRLEGDSLNVGQKLVIESGTT